MGQKAVGGRALATHLCEVQLLLASAVLWGKINVEGF